MNIIIDYLTKDFLKVFGGFSLFGILVAVLVYVSRQIAKLTFDQKMENYKKVMSEELENLKLQHQKNYKDFELFISVKHEKYPEMYFHLETAYGQVFALRGMGRFLTFENVDERDLNVYFDELMMTSFDKARIFVIWNVDKQSAINEIREMERIL